MKRFLFQAIAFVYCISIYAEAHSAEITLLEWPVAPSFTIADGTIEHHTILHNYGHGYWAYTSESQTWAPANAHVGIDFIRLNPMARRTTPSQTMKRAPWLPGKSFS